MYLTINGGDGDGAGDLARLTAVNANGTVAWMAYARGRMLGG